MAKFPYEGYIFHLLLGTLFTHQRHKLVPFITLFFRGIYHVLVKSPYKMNDSLFIIRNGFRGILPGDSEGYFMRFQCVNASSFFYS